MTARVDVLLCLLLESASISKARAILSREPESEFQDLGGCGGDGIVARGADAW